MMDRDGGPSPSPADRIGPAARLPLPAQDGRRAWRQMTPEDLPAVAELVAACEDFDDPPYRTSPEELHGEFFGVSSADPARDTLIGIRPDGGVDAYGRVRLIHAPGETVRVLVGGGVHPRLRREGLGADILAWQTSRASQILAERDEGRPGMVVTYVEEGMADQAAMLTAAGFRPVRWYTELRRDLTSQIETVSLHSALRVEPWRDELAEQVRRANSEAFYDQSDHEVAGAEPWQDNAEHFAPQWSFVVLDRSTDRTPIAGYLLSSRYEQDWAGLGYRAGHTDLLGVRQEWRGRRVATALLTAAMRAYAADGMDVALLEVDTDHPDVAFDLYERLGYRASRGSTMYALEVQR